MFNYKAAIEDKLVVPQIYTYPPRKTFTNTHDFLDLDLIWQKDSAYSDEIHLYIHIPFWKYKCIYCNLFAFNLSYNQDELISQYIDALCIQIEQAEKNIHSRKIKSIHFGGGDPLLLSYQYISRIFSTIKRTFDNILDIEISLESTPYSVVESYKNGDLDYIISLGISRINVGMYPFEYENNELNKSVPVYNKSVTLDALKFLKKLKINNISLDLMLGNKYDQLSEWLLFLEEIISLKPDTISFFPLVFRNDSLHGLNQNISYYTSNDAYLWEEVGRCILLENNYLQQNSYRYVKNKGGNLQEDAHFSMKSIMGFGCGARSYNNVNDYMVTTDYSKGLVGIVNYIDKCKNGTLEELIVYSYPYTKDEIIRKYFVLSQPTLDISDFEAQFFKIDQKYINFLDHLVEHKYMYNIEKKYYYSELGLKHRDIIAIFFYSIRSLKSDSDLYDAISKFIE